MRNRKGVASVHGVHVTGSQAKLYTMSSCPCKQACGTDKVLSQCMECTSQGPELSRSQCPHAPAGTHARKSDIAVTHNAE
eukprot:1145148-Pelagomonas_calceolata.AAC.2